MTMKRRANMKNYKVKIIEYLQRLVDVTDESSDEAAEKIE